MTRSERDRAAMAQQFDVVPSHMHGRCRSGRCPFPGTQQAAAHGHESARAVRSKAGANPRVRQHVGAGLATVTGAA